MDRFFTSNASLFGIIGGYLSDFYSLIKIFDPVPPSTLHLLKSRVFKKATAFSPSNITIKTAKFDGYKAKMICNFGRSGVDGYFYDGDIFLCDCWNNIFTVKFVNLENFLSNFPNVAFQFEIMQTAPENHFNNAILVDVCGGMIGKDMFILPPLDAFLLIQNFKIKNPKSATFSSNIKDGYFYFTCNDNKKQIIYRLCAQTSIKVGSETFDKIDGYLIMSGCGQSKIKLPTCDFRIIQGSLVFDAIKSEDKFILSLLDKLKRFKSASLENGIYELSFNSLMDVVVFRFRNEKHFPAEEYEILSFLGEIKTLYAPENEDVTNL